MTTTVHKNNNEKPVTCSSRSRGDNGNQQKPDLSEAERLFLSALLIDKPISDDSEKTASTTKVLDDDILFSLPFHQVEPPKRRRDSLLLGLWHAFEGGVRPKTLLKHASSLHARPRLVSSGRVQKQASSAEELVEGDESVISIRSDVEVRGDVDEEDVSSCASWNEEDGGQEHFDAWEVLKDEYAEDFGFDYKEHPELVEEDQGHVFRIIGTSADDVGAHPHVLSPPLMDALMSFIPETLENQNFWLKYSLVRDGSSMDTLKHYVRASSNTILAIETTTGEVFGAFCTSPWRNHLGFFGVGDGAFLWRMRYNRNTPCHSLFEQAQMETDIAVYAYSGLNNLIQHCSHNRIGIGGGDLNKYIEKAAVDGSEEIPPAVDLARVDSCGFGIMIGEDLATGSTGPCATFRNPCLLNNSAQAETFTIANMEVWTLTPAFDLNQAQKLEMTKYFVDQSTHSEDSSIHSRYSITTPPRSPTPFAAEDFNQRRFYRRVGEYDENEAERLRWQHANIMGLP